MRAGQAAPQRRVLVICVNNRRTARLQPGKDFTFGACHRFHRAQPLQMRAAGVGDQRHVRTGDMRQVIDFAGMVHAHFDHGITMLRVQ